MKLVFTIALLFELSAKISQGQIEEERYGFFIQRIELLKNEYSKQLPIKISARILQWDTTDYESIVFFTEQELEENGIDNKNLFDSSESFGVKRKVDELIDELKNLRNDIERLKTGQQITYDDFIEEFENLKEQTYLDKKTWRQILMGKLFEMTMSGVISESLSKKIIDIFGDIFPVETIKKLTE